MKYAKIENNIIIQIQPNKEDGFVKVDENVVCGMIQNEDGSFSNPIIEVVQVIPQIVTMRQARLALLQSGILADVETAIQNGTDEVLKIEWEYSTTVKRDWQNLITLASSLGLTEEHLDNLFILANTL